jgi:lipoprotein-anchoring transpeptidase ErfK/SrfK
MRGRRRGEPPAGLPHDTAAAAAILPESFEDIAAGAVNHPVRLPLSSAGPSVLRVQVLLDRAGFSPGILDARWGKNTEKALYWFQASRGLEATGTADTATIAALERAGGGGAAAITSYALAADDLEGPFVDIPEDIYARAELPCQCYESVMEKLTERFHVDPEVLEQLNPGLEPERLATGTRLWVPAVEERFDAGRPIARVVVSKQGFYTQALDADGAILYHFPSTLGAGYDPSPAGRLRVAAIIFDPHYHYQPDLFHEVPDDEPEAILAAGPNSPVGVVWIALSRAHYGIHGTAEPQTIGYVTSHGCVRLTNWDARYLAERVRKGVPVVFTS